MLHDELSAQARVGDRSIRLVRVAPRPDARALLRGLDRAVGQLARPHEGHVAVVLLGFLVDEREHATRAGDTEGNHWELHRHLADRLGEVADHSQEGHDDAYRDHVDAEQVQVRGLTQDHDAADDRDDDVHDVADVTQGRHEDVAVSIRLLGGVEELGVVLDELVLGVLLVVEDLNDLLAVHHLLDEPFLVGQSLLLGLHVAAREPSKLPGQERHQTPDHEDDEGQPHRVVEHRTDQHNDREARLNEGGNGLADHLSDRVRVVRECRHDRPVRVRVEEAQGQALHGVEHVVAHVLERPLRHDRHCAGVHETADDADAEDDGHHDDEAHEGGAHGLKALVQPGGNDRVDDLLHEDGPDGRGHRRHDDAHDGQADAHRIVAHDVANQASEGALDTFELLGIVDAEVSTTRHQATSLSVAAFWES